MNRTLYTRYTRLYSSSQTDKYNVHITLLAGFIYIYIYKHKIEHYT